MIEHAIADTLDEAPHEVTAMLEAMKAGRLPLCARALPLASRADPHDVRRASPTRVCAVHSRDDQLDFQIERQPEERQRRGSARR